MFLTKQLGLFDMLSRCICDVASFSYVIMLLNYVGRFPLPPAYPGSQTGFRGGM